MREEAVTAGGWQGGRVCGALPGRLDVFLPQPRPKSDRDSTGSVSLSSDARMVLPSPLRLG